MLIKSRILFLILPLFLLGCGGDKSNLSNEEIGPNYSGIYFGSFTTLSGPPLLNQNATVLISENNRVTVLLHGNTGHISGKLTNNNEELYASWSLYAENIANVFHSKYEDIQVSLEATETGFLGNWESNDSSGRVVFAKDENQEQPTTSEQLAKNWSLNFGSSNGDLFTLSITIDSEGLIVGSDTNGCVFSGNIDEVELTKRIPPFKMEVSSCNQLDGNYEGLMAILTGSSQFGDKLFMLPSNNSHSFSPLLNQ